MALYVKNSNNELELYDSPYLTSELYPVGFVYVQFPGSSSPPELGLPGTWSNISSQWSSYFFRAEGGSAAAFGSCQAMGTCYACISSSTPSKSVLHCHSIRTSYPDYTFRCGSSTPKSYMTEKTFSLCSSGNHSHSATFSNTTETRPANYTIRIWKRIS